MKKSIDYYLKAIKKFIRFSLIYGVSRSIVKAAGRIRKNFPNFLFIPSNKIKKDIALVGAGQFAFSTICFFIRKKLGNVFLVCYDREYKNALTLAKFYNFKKVAKTFDELLNDKSINYCYIVSNHASHSQYAEKLINNGVVTYIEKPMSVNENQFYSLLKKYKESKTKIFSGYNRPFSKAIIRLKNTVFSLTNDVKAKCSFSVNYFVCGHKLPENHWYRNPKEGTRICGNMGHWIDLSIHMLAWRNLPEFIYVNIAYSNAEEPDDNLTVMMTTSKNDLFIITLTSRTEPFEGIDETINFQFSNIIAKIDDFRKIKIWQEDKLYKKKYWPKDVGHEKAVMQPFNKSGFQRNIDEVFLSTKLMLFIKDMVLERKRYAEFNVCEEIEDVYNHTGYKLNIEANETDNPRP